MLSSIESDTTGARRVGSQSEDRERVGDHVTIFRTPASPRWYMQFNQDGRQFKLSLRTTSKKQATLLARRKDAELTLGQAGDPRRRPMTIRAIALKYLESQKTHVTELSLLLYTRDTTQFAQFSEDVGIQRLDRVTAEHLEQFEEQLRTTGPPRAVSDISKKSKAARPNKPRTIRGKMKTIRQMIKWAVRRRLIPHDPTPGYRLPPPIKSRAEPFTPAELKTILTAAEQPYKDIFDFLRLTGLRSGELCWLMKVDVDSDLQFIHVREKVCPFTRTRWKPKHGRERIVPLAAAAEIAQRRLNSADGPWLFCNPDSKGDRAGQFTRPGILQALKSVKKSNGITHGTVHTFRHNFCSFVANHSTMKPPQLMKIMGHANLETTMIYYHVGKEDLMNEMAAVDFCRMLETETIAGKSSEDSAKSK